jgi:hypothetical protein
MYSRSFRNGGAVGWRSNCGWTTPATDSGYRLRITDPDDGSSGDFPASMTARQMVIEFVLGTRHPGCATE